MICLTLDWRPRTVRHGQLVCLGQGDDRGVV
jgi:hypothetical protein